MTEFQEIIRRIDTRFVDLVKSLDVTHNHAKGLVSQLGDNKTCFTGKLFFVFQSCLKCLFINI